MNQTQSFNQHADILIVDDVPNNIRFLSNFLLDRGYQVRKAISGQMALRTIDALIPDLVLLDVNLPDISGYEVCRELKENPLTNSIPIVFLSAGNDAIDKIKAFEAGASDYITKPFHLEEVLVRIQTQLTIQALQKELRMQNEQLKDALQDLKVAQANLVQQEKMATLRKVVAGVAHEVNNPLSFIACNIKPAQDHIQQLVSLIELYQQKFGDTDPEIQAWLEEMDLEFVTSDLRSILASMGNGTDRIRTVMLALRIFTRLDESGIKQIDIHENLNSVLALLRHRLDDREDGIQIQVQKDYGALPLITCYAEQFNQVMFNLLCNAIDAINAKFAQTTHYPTTPEISIRTRLGEDRILTVSIKDNGIGIPKIIQSRIFEPFFTTKLAGQGVGLGLATSLRIIEEIHGGRLIYTSVENEGTEFVIQMPA
ncbi:MAG: response regulator [Scytolyngbya sp. HA4215-MV1]|jgi:signal transduction histidine kinase|nr:response regulator [Scytolyngbya sp. HA4215-MV1]